MRISWQRQKKLVLDNHNNSNRSNIADHRLIHILGLQLETLKTDLACCVEPRLVDDDHWRLLCITAKRRLPSTDAIDRLPRLYAKRYICCMWWERDRTPSAIGPPVRVVRLIILFGSSVKSCKLDRPKYLSVCLFVIIPVFC